AAGEIALRQRAAREGRPSDLEGLPAVGRAVNRRGVVEDGPLVEIPARTNCERGVAPGGVRKRSPERECLATIGRVRPHELLSHDDVTTIRRYGDLGLADRKTQTVLKDPGRGPRRRWLRCLIGALGDRWRQIELLLLVVGLRDRELRPYAERRERVAQVLN